MCEIHPHYFIILYHGSLSLALFIISLDANIPNIYFSIFFIYWDPGRPQPEALWIELHISIMPVSGTVFVGVAMIDMYSSDRYRLMVIFPRRLHQSASTAVYGSS